MFCQVACKQHTRLYPFCFDHLNNLVTVYTFTAGDQETKPARSGILTSLRKNQLVLRSFECFFQIIEVVNSALYEGWKLLKLCTADCSLHVSCFEVISKMRINIFVIVANREFTILAVKAMLGAYAAQMGFGLPSIGGKDSMSGSFDELNVPPTLVSFAVDVASENDVVTPEFKKAGNKLVLFAIEKDEYDLPNYEQVKKLYGQIHEAVRNGQIVSSYAIGAGGIAEAVSKMAFGNGLGAVINAQLDKNLLFAPLYGNILAEVPAECIADLEVPCEVIGEVSAEPTFTYGEIVISMDEAVKSWKSTLEKVFPSVSGKTQPKVDTGIYKADSIYVCKNKVAKPKVFIPVFPGTNCEYG